ncbi:MAG: hypothetical protein OER86_12470 [Phycisphaerae bacterium]|nr:hypothetical protein [Phycisphaerae bacterium]
MVRILDQGDGMPARQAGSVGTDADDQWTSPVVTHDPLDPRRSVARKPRRRPRRPRQRRAA